MIGFYARPKSLENKQRLLFVTSSGRIKNRARDRGRTPLRGERNPRELHFSLHSCSQRKNVRVCKEKMKCETRKWTIIAIWFDYHLYISTSYAPHIRINWPTNARVCEYAKRIRAYTCTRHTPSPSLSPSLHIRAVHAHAFIYGRFRRVDRADAASWQNRASSEPTPLSSREDSIYIRNFCSLTQKYMHYTRYMSNLPRGAFAVCISERWRPGCALIRAESGRMIMMWVSNEQIRHDCNIRGMVRPIRMRRRRWRDHVERIRAKRLAT
jgi:hypothetical protein